MTEEERKAEYMRKYRAEHREEINANARYWKSHNKEKVNEYQRRYKQTLEGREKNRMASKAYYDRNKNDPEFMAKKRANAQRWIENNRERFNAYQRERYHRKKLAERAVEA